VLTGAQSFGTWRYLLDERLNRQPEPSASTLVSQESMSVVFYLALGAAGGLGVLVVGGSVIWWLAARNRRPRM
jgi:hypothetical protein